MKRILRSLFGIIICITISIIVFTYNVKAGVCGSDDDGFICCNSFHTFGHGNNFLLLIKSSEPPLVKKVVYPK